ncbi:MAG: formylglycine-generating enzyme family protein [Anaerolineaceae bacterium]|nr:MAG: formylglycine-generating enzyme family protein [Anaerolineaceae bacterium]
MYRKRGRSLILTLVIGLLLAACGGRGDQDAGRTPVNRNADWTPVEREFELPQGGMVTMVLVPAGCFMMGSTDEQVSATVAAGLSRIVAEREQPPHEQCFDEPFWIDKYLVTNGQYGSSGWLSGDDLPRESVNWFDARDFCEARGGRLPTEAEWEYSARGPDGLIYPWGDEFIVDNVISSENTNRRTVDVGSRLSGASWVGALDMAGNVWEWTGSLFEPYPYHAGDGRERDTGDSTDVQRVLRGGSFGSSSQYLRAPLRNWYNPDGWGNGYGFRCARSFE